MPFYIITEVTKTFPRGYWLVEAETPDEAKEKVCCRVDQELRYYPPTLKDLEAKEVEVIR